jgi:hypothetical protein
MPLTDEQKREAAEGLGRLQAAMRRDELVRQGITVLSIERALSPRRKALRALRRQWLASRT